MIFALFAQTNQPAQAKIIDEYETIFGGLFINLLFYRQ